MNIENDYWLEKWRNGQTTFHRQEPHPFLPTLFDDVPAGTIFVPLCGKTLDMVWLRDRGHRILGAEPSELACRSFFEEQKLPYRERVDGDFLVFEADRITIWCGDLFQMRVYATAGITAVYDRAAMVALPPSRWDTYTRHLRRLMGDENAARVPIRLITVEYPGEFLTLGPPFAITHDDLRKVWKPFYRILPLEHRRDLSLEKHPRLGGAEVTEASYRLVPLRP